MAPRDMSEGIEYTGFNEALALIHSNISPLEMVNIPLSSCPGFVIADDLKAKVNVPNSDVSLMDGFAVRIKDISEASPEHPVFLKVMGSGYAGAKFEGEVLSGEAVKITSGSSIPRGADAVIANEFTEETPKGVYIKEKPGKEKNIFFAGDDIRSREVVLLKGQLLSPARSALAAASGIDVVKVYRKPVVVVIATGDELASPGQELREGQLYASNPVNISSWLSAYGITCKTIIVGDREDSIRQILLDVLPKADGIITSGGAWSSERDLIVHVLESLHWKILFRRVRLIPGKGTAFGMLEGKPVFCLPGGPSANDMAFLQLALPGILRLAGRTGSVLMTVSVQLKEALKGRQRSWTEFKKASLIRNSDGGFIATPLKEVSRLKSMAAADCLICLQEGTDFLPKGQQVSAQLLVPSPGDK